MGMPSDPTDLLAAVERSPHAAGGHDREGWVGLFAADGTICDPVGSRPHTGHRQIERFYDTFIGPRDITFHRGADVVAGSTVVRDLSLEVRMGSSVTMQIPVFLRYDLNDDLLVARLQAYWELPAMVWQFARSGVGALPAGVQLSRALVRNQGLAGTAGFLSGFGRVGGHGRRQLAAVLDAGCCGDEVSVRRRLTDAVTITRGDTHRMGTSELVAILAGADWGGMISAGRHVVVRVTRNGRRGVLFGEFASRPTRIQAVRVFADDEWT